MGVGIAIPTYGGGLPFGLRHCLGLRLKAVRLKAGQVLRKRNTALPYLTQKPSLQDLGCGRSPR